MKIRDLTGQKFHKLEVLYRAGSNRSGRSQWMCRCECGVEKIFCMDHLTRKKSPVKSCGCFAKSLKGKDHPQWTGVGEISGNWWYNHVARERKQTSRVKVPVTISIQHAWDLFLKQGRKCSLSGIELKISGSYRYNTASIDRIDSSKGYEEGNIQWVHKHINFMKRTYSQEYFIEMCKKVANHKKDDNNE